MSKYMHSGRPQSSRCKRTTRPRLEALESRLVLSSTVLPTVPSPNPFPGAGTESAIVEGLYNNILGRVADSAGLAHWTAQLTAPGGSAAQVAGQFFQSTEYTTDVVESYYTTYLGRVGDTAGVASWVATLQAGASEEQVAAAFLSSPEYSAKNVTNGAFVQSLYENVLGRAGDQAGINNWTQVLAAGTSRAAVAADFIGSPESSQISVDGDYNDFLGRVGDTAGVNSWVAQIQNGSMTMAEVAAAFGGSSEYAARHPQPVAPAVTGLYPASAPPTGLTPVTITGTGFTGATAVDFGTTVLTATQFKVLNDNTITATSPAGTIGTVDVTVKTPVGTSATSAADQFTYTVDPVVTGLTPTVGSTAGGTPVTITGINFTGATAVDFGTAAATSFTVGGGGTTITAVPPASTALGVVDVTVITSAGTSAIVPADKFTYSVAPAVTSLSPTSGPPAGGTPVTITGTGFTGATAVDFGSTAATDLTVVNNTEITADSPAGTIGVPVDVTVITPVGTSATSIADHFTYTVDPVVTSLSPTIGPAAGVTPVTITGSNFTGATAVDFGTAAATSFTVGVGGTTITAVPPASTALGVVDVTVITPAGTSAIVPADKFTYSPAPAVTSLSPTSGSAAGGTLVTITGTNFTDATAVEFGSTPATDLTVGGGGTTITADSPAGTVLSVVAVRVTTPAGQSATSNADLFTYTAAVAPTVTGLSPTSGSNAGGTSVTITGTSFTGATVVDFGSTVLLPSQFTVVNDTTIKAVSPASTATTPSTVDVTVKTPGFTSATSNADKFTYTAAVAPTVTGLTPATGPNAGGTFVTITGTSFTGATAVDFGTTVLTATQFTVVNDNTITATSPAGTIGVVDVTVKTPGFTSATGNLDKFTYIAAVAPTVTLINPTTGPSGTAVTIIGTSFTGETAVDFGSTPATGITVVNDNTITATSPAGTGIVDVTVTTPAGTSATSTADKFTYSVAAPVVTGLSPTSGPTGTGVTITGTGFTGVTVVDFGQTAVPAFTVFSPTQITAFSPAGTGTVNVTVTSPGGQSATSNNDQFTYTT